jgi:hypothetical protein
MAGVLSNSDTGNFNSGAIVDASNKIAAETRLSRQSKGRWRILLLRTRQRRKTSSRWMEKKCWEIRGFELSSWNFIGHDPKQFRHYGPMAQDFYAAFGQDELGQIGTETTINSGDLAGILMVAVQALEKRTAELK